MQSLKIRFLAVSIACINGSVFAQDLASHQPVVVTLPEINITATRTPNLVNNTIAQITVIDEEKLQRYQGQSVLDVLRQQAGFYVTQNGGDGTSGNFYLRGYSSNQVLVLIDGIRYASTTLGTPALSLIPADQIDRIEVLHGASGASLYGADAMGGVIQIFTKGQSAIHANVAVTVGVGTQDSYKAQITSQSVSDKTTLSVSTGYEKTDGINATKPKLGAFKYNPDTEEFESKNASLVAKHRFNDNVEVGVTGLLAKSTNDYDSASQVNRVDVANYPNTYQKNENGAVSAFAIYQKDKLKTNVKYGQSFDKSTAYDGSSPNGNVLNTKQEQINLQLDYQLPVGTVIGGLEYLKQNADVNATWATYEKDRKVKSAFVNYLLTQPKYDIQAGVRLDDHSEYDKHDTYNIGGAYHILPNTRIGMAYATGFKAPTVQDIYFSRDGKVTFQTNKNWETFVENRGKNHVTRLTSYQTDYKNKIVWINNATSNVPNSSIKGVNLTSDWRLNNILFGVNYDYQKAENDDTKQILVHHPKNRGLIYVGYQQPKFDVRAEAQYVSETTSPNFDTNVAEKLNSYTLLNISGNYYVNPNLTLSSRVNNLTDKDYETIYGYNQKGINAFISATYQWF